MHVTCPHCSVPRAHVIWASEQVIAYTEPDEPNGSSEHAVITTRRHVTSYFDATAEERAEIWRALDAIKSQLDARWGNVPKRITFDNNEADRHGAGHLCVQIARCVVGETQADLPVHAPQAAAPMLTTGPTSPLGPLLFRDLEHATQVDIAVAFVFVAALNAGVLSRLRDVLARKGSRVRLLTGDYQNVTEPAALRLLLTLREQAQASEELHGEFQLRVFQTAKTQSSFHPKAYLLHSDAQGAPLATYVGSSNLSRTGLFDGVEWNLRLADAAAAQVTHGHFERLFAHAATCEVTHEWIAAYEERRQADVTPRLDVATQEDAPVPVPTPNPVQQEALERLEATREAGNRAGLVVLATGLGKTWLSAFDSTPERGFQRVLFVAHRSEILSQAMATFARIQPNAALGLYTGQEKSIDANLLFASVQTLSQREHLERFNAKHFDYIVVDEFHHAAAETYRRVLDYFEPKFMLGLTATPERTDGGDLLALCDENLVFECGLATGVRSKLLCPFHYFGVPDLVEYEQIPWRGRKFDEAALTSAVATSARAQNALEQLEKHGGKRALGFCVSQRHADFMREYFREHTTLRCASVHAGPTSDSRSLALEQLAKGELDVLFCVDMFNEGLDVPSIDTVLMLRPTESKVIWLQQLGRGLRRHASKSHLRVIDYIGNHRSFLNKPAALLSALDVSVSSLRQLTRLIAEQRFTLPEGCEVTYDLEVQRILERLCPPSRTAETIREWYVSFREHGERRPTAREALHSGYHPQEVHKDYGSWLDFVRAMGDLGPDAEAALEANREFLSGLETLESRKSDELVLLDALRAMGKLGASVNLRELTTAYRHRVLRSAALRADVPVAIDNDAALERFLRERPVQAWCGRSNRGQRWFTLEENTLSSNALSGGEVLSHLTAEVVEWRLAEYLSRRPSRSILDVTRAATGEPILKLNRKTYDLPQDWVMVVADSAPYRAHYRSHVVDVATTPDGENNELGALLKRWFGDEAGKPGGQHRVVQMQERDGSLSWKPLKPAQLVDAAGGAIDATFECVDFEGEPTIVFHSRGGGPVPRNSEYHRGLGVLLERLRDNGVQVTRIAVESSATRTLPVEKRAVPIAGVAYPINLKQVASVEDLRKKIGRAVAQVGRERDAKGSGNSTKRLRLWLDQRVDEATLATG